MKTGMKVTAGHIVTRGATGRVTEYMTSEQLKQEELVIDWLKCKSVRKLLKHSSARLFRKQIQNNPVIKNPSLILFRGRFKDEDMKPAVEPKHFGPPPAEYTKPGRYNTDGNPVLYLSTSEHGVFCELYQTGKTDLFCQKYILPVNGLKIADFSLNSIDNFIRIVFDYAEYGTRNGIIDTDDYIFSQVVAKLVKETGFDGMVVLGVRGTVDYRYNNIVIFDPSTWTEWVDYQSRPKCIDHLVEQT